MIVAMIQMMVYSLILATGWLVSVDFLSVLVSIALVISATAPASLLFLLVRDWRRGKLW